MLWKPDSLTDSVIREIKEQTGFKIYKHTPCVLKIWIPEFGSCFIVFFYKTNRYEGELNDSGEGKVFWIEWEDVNRVNLIWNMRELLEIFNSDKYSEFFFKIENGQWEGRLLG